MSEHMDDMDNDDEQQGSSIKDLRDAADRGTKAQRELAFVKAGIDTDTPLGAMFLDAYKGEITKDAIKSSWNEIVPAAPATETAPPPTPAPEGTLPVPDEAEARAAHDAARRGIATTPSTPPDPNANRDENPMQAAYAEHRSLVADGVEPMKAAKPVIDAIFAGAAAGDERFLWKDGWSEDEMQQGRTRRT